MITAMTTPKTERVEARVTPEQKEFFQRAADLEGQSFSDFLIRALLTAAEDTVQRHRIMRMTIRESRAFAEAYLNPGEPNDALKKYANRGRELFGE